MKNKQRRHHFLKHKHGTPNPIIAEEQNAMLAAVRKARTTGDTQTIGRNGEVPFRSFLDRYLPFTLRARTGHFISPTGHLSPQIDVMILDARYPLLCENPDTSVLAMLHSVIATIEVKTRITTKDVGKMWQDAMMIISLASEIPQYRHDEWGSLHVIGFAYESAVSLRSLIDRYEISGRPNQTPLDLYLLHLPHVKRTTSVPLGGEFHFEPRFESEKSDRVTEWFPTYRPTYTALSDLYYCLVQDAYYTLGHRNYSPRNIGEHLMKYMAWATTTWDNYFEILELTGALKKRISKK